MAKNARFWALVNCCPVKITLKPDQKLERYQGGPTEEGYHREWESWEYDGEAVTSTIETDGHDCDGRLSTHSEWSCPVDRMMGGDHPFRPVYTRFKRPDGTWFGCDEWQEDTTIRWPDWTEGRRRQRDYSAEAMGY